jgi:23S rRNA (guanosine2251-2'-O)-methyltransferase
MNVYGFNAVLEALRAGRVRRLQIGPRSDRRTGEALTLAKQHRVPVERVDVQALERIARGGVHQGIAAELEPIHDYSVQQLVEAAAPDAPLLVVLDGVEDPHNVGAIVRTVDAAGAHGIVRQARHAASLDGATAKASAGAVAFVRVATW